MSRTWTGRLARIVAITGCLIILGAGTVLANDVFEMTATGVVRTAIVITEHQALDFSQGGDLYQGVSKAVGIDEAGTGSFIITAAAGDNIQAQLLLPEYLWCATAGVKQRVDIFFGPTDAAWDNTGDPDPETAVGATVVDPTNLPTMTVAGGQTTVNLFLGATVYPSAYQKAGTYTGSVILSAWYEGD
ncbi:MAG: hypothetical protein GY839_12755 [candidate division Zixibacteria bacterium]|nr:hypothetical protein [candidate division Zixibacteria bacterium]